ncbi:GAP family protein [Arthrobacter sp. zg-Y820]|uniref:GAP family protein n=1 Tax=unclassified Arthrobacter TaxID=235627 RepID=UPI001E5E00BC|nr:MULTISPECIES: GAP family protein [unclassified Arthrobacter]MCC9196672.1 GAP family protein [Arthrobacter sp. zg-Y820]MDK1279534.1 GAP family protein [Arthrobacter sp. zg.Y820]WIB08090.1 GAP family protein [Arthrobacter sp. zg-Y820]
MTLAGAVSSVPVSITVMILLSPTPRRGAVPFLCGSLAGSIVLVGLSAVGLHLPPARPSLNQVTVPAVLCIAVGAGLAVYGAYLVQRKPRAGKGRLDKLRTVLAYAAVAQSAVVVPIGIWLRSPDTAQGHLSTLYAWMQAHGHTITAVTALVLGLSLVAWNVLQLAG